MHPAIIKDFPTAMQPHRCVFACMFGIRWRTSPCSYPSPSFLVFPMDVLRTVWHVPTLGIFAFSIPEIFGLGICWGGGGERSVSFRSAATPGPPRRRNSPMRADVDGNGSLRSGLLRVHLPLRHPPISPTHPIHFSSFSPHFVFLPQRIAFSLPPSLRSPERETEA